MWTPRRIGLLLLAFFLFAGTYAGYSRALGWLDGLPQLPVSKLPKNDPTTASVMPPKAEGVSPTELRIIEAFGPNAAERSRAYATKLEFRNGDTSVVLAAGPFPLEPGTSKVALVPFSMAVFGKPKPAHLRQPGETVEINTFHADKAILEYDRPISTPQDLSKAKLMRMELVSDPEEALPDPRRGKVHITNNQNSLDPNHMLVLRTPGPVFYRDAKAMPVPDNGPDVWTDAPVEVVDRKNLPRPFGTPSPRTVEEPRGSDYRDGRAVMDILSAQRLPPPTLTGVGLRLFFEQEKTAAQAKPEKKPGSGVGGVRRIELNEKVLINLWVDSNTNFTGEPNPAPADKPAPPKESSSLTAVEPPKSASALTGGLLDGVQSTKLFNRALLQIETLGPFSYDSATSTARFDVVAQANPEVPNDVQVSRILPRGEEHYLFSQVLEIEFNGSPTGGPAPQPAANAAAPAATPGPSFKRLHAWTLPGNDTHKRFVTLTTSQVGEKANKRPTLNDVERKPANDDEQTQQLVAFGDDLEFDQPTNRTILQGFPLYVIRGRNILTAGGQKPKRSGKLVMEPGPGPEKKTTMTVHGPGQFDLYDPAAKANNLQARWKTSLRHTKEKVDDREVDLLTFTDGAAFEDKQADYRLEGNVLKLWMDGQKPENAPKTEGNNQSLPRRIQAVGNVTAHSREFDIEQADQLNVLFQDTPPAPALPPQRAEIIPPAPVNGSIPPPAGAGTIVSTTPNTPAPPAEKPKPPMKLSARLIDTFVLRIPQIPTPDAPKPANPKPGEGGSVRYELKTVRCEDRVTVHQDPSDPEKARGVDILAQTLDVKQSPQGSEMTVTGSDTEPGQVHYEAMSIIGPKVFMDQVSNRTRVEGRGVLQMPANSDLSGNELKQQEDVKVFWRDGMDFAGALKTAEFRGKVVAQQGESWVTCHRMIVGFDRPVYFNQMKKPGGEPLANKTAGKEGPKIQSVKCEPAPGDAAEDTRSASRVWFNEVVRDPVTKAVVKSQLLEAEELTLESPGKTRDPQNNVYAYGQGVVRIWQPGQKDWATTGGENKPEAKKTEAPKGAEQEMKLTIIKYGGRMTVQDKKVFQEAVFSDNIQVIHAPSNDPNAKIELHQLPPGSVLLTCNDTLSATTHRRADNSTTQGMVARGNAYIRTDEYEGWGETIDYDGRQVVLKGSKNAPARIMSRFGRGSENSGREIKLDRLTNRYELVDGVSGQIVK